MCEVGLHGDNIGCLGSRSWVEGLPESAGRGITGMPASFAGASKGSSDGEARHTELLGTAIRLSRDDGR